MHSSTQKLTSKKGASSLLIISLILMAIGGDSSSQYLVCQAKHNVHVETEFAGESQDRGEIAYRGVYNLKEIKRLENVRKKEMDDGSKSHKLDDETKYQNFEREQERMHDVVEKQQSDRNSLLDDVIGFFDDGKHRRRDIVQYDQNSGVLTEDEQDQMSDIQSNSKYTKQEVMLIKFYKKLFAGLLVSFVILSLSCLLYRKFFRKSVGRTRLGSQRSYNEFNSATTKTTNSADKPTRKPQKLQDEVDSDYVDDDKVLEV